MPELPEVEVIADELTELIGGILLSATISGKRLRGNLVLNRPGGGFETFLGHRLRSVGRRGRYLILEFSDNLACLVHLGMSGYFKLKQDLDSASFGTAATKGAITASVMIAARVTSTARAANATTLHSTKANYNAPLAKHEHVRLCFSSGILSYFDTRRFGAWELIKGPVKDLEAALLAHPWLKALGAEPITFSQLDVMHPKVRHFKTKLDAEYLLHQAELHPKLILKEFLMDNRIITGIGNIYANELLFKARWHPRQLASNLDLAAFKKLTALIEPLMLEAVRLGGSTIRDYQHSDGKSGEFQHTLKVYGRAGKRCYICNKALQLEMIKGRSSVFCPVCQRLK